MKSFPVLAAAVLLAGCQSLGPGGTLPAPTAGASVERLALTVDPEYDVREGAVTYPLGVGSGLAFAGFQGDSLVYWAITDRGPNLDGPAVGSLSSKVFPAPSFRPSLVEIRVKEGTARVIRTVPLKSGAQTVSGLPLPAGAVGFTQEAALSLDLKDLGSDLQGLDTEAIQLDPATPGMGWISDEYGPFIARVNLAKGSIEKKYGPGSGLPDILAKRQPNRGMEGLAVTPSGLVVGVVQSILDVDGKVKTSRAPFVRVVTLDPATGKTAMYAYPIDATYKKAADAKIGDLAAVSETEFLILEQGNDKKGARNIVYRFSLKNATDLTGKKTAEGKELETLSSAEELKAAGVEMAVKTKVLDLRAEWGWTVEKAEGLAILDNRRFAVISDNDFGVATVVEEPALGSDGKPVTDPAAYSLNGGVLTLDGKPTGARLKAGDNGQPTAFWVFTTEKPFY